jgi:hypothetical protein
VEIGDLEILLLWGANDQEKRPSVGLNRVRYECRNPRIERFARHGRDSIGVGKAKSNFQDQAGDDETSPSAVGLFPPCPLLGQRRSRMTTALSVDEKYDLITRRLQEVLKGEEIRKILEEAAQPGSARVLKLYWGVWLGLFGVGSSL